MSNPVNFFIVPSAVLSVTCRSGTVYTPVNNIITNVAAGDIIDVINQGGRQVGGPDAAATMSSVTGRFYNPMPGSTPATLLTVASTIYAYPVRLPGNLPITTIAASVSTGQTGGKVRFGLYTDVNGAPGVLVPGTDSGDQVATGAAVATFTPATPITLVEGWYWMVVTAAATSTMPTLAALAAGYVSDANRMLGQDTAAHAFAASGQSSGGVTSTFTYGALPANFPTAGFALSLNAAVPMLVLGY